MRPFRKSMLALVVAGVLGATTPAAAATLSARGAVSQQEVFVGEPFTYQVQVSGSEQPEEPDLSAVAEFDVQKLGGQQNSSQSVTIINGRVNRVVNLGYVFSYQLTPKRAGSWVIPAVAVRAEGQVTRTQPVPIQVRQPAETQDFKLRMELSKAQGYVGEPIRLTLRWYLRQNVNGFNFSVPALELKAFALADRKVDTSTGGPYYRIPLNRGEAIGRKSQARLDGLDYATIEFSKVLIPQEAGTFNLEPALVACEALMGYRNSRSPLDSFFNDDFFNDFFRDDFFGRRRGVFRKVVVPSNALALEVRPLPSAGRPDNFAGHVGKYELTAAASPTEVSVGDPITLTMTLSGPEFVEHIGPPDLSRQPALNRDFKIPTEMAQGVSDGRQKTFTQTLRALHPQVAAIPPIELPYFDTPSGQYRVARSAPIPLTVRAAKVVTAKDAEGLASPGSAAVRLEAWAQGIAHNYEGESVLEPQTYGLMFGMATPSWLALLIAPPLGYFALLGAVLYTRRRNADPARNRARKAQAQLAKRLDTARTAPSADAQNQVLEALRHYLGDKLGLPPGALTFKDVQSPLAARGLDPAVLEQLKQAFQSCEAGRYAGGALPLETASLVETCQHIAQQMERQLG
ncbi:MAG: protein BatD [Verrucomicrobia bacterium]|nr:protein BatD [Verrucomicrobiota bacterium]